MIPDSWIQEREQLVVTSNKQSAKDYKWEKDEKPVLDADIAALDLLLVTDEELSIVNLFSRGQYKAGDTRGYVLTQERTCLLWNAWMRRSPKGTEQYISENPADILAAGHELPPFIEVS